MRRGAHERIAKKINDAWGIEVTIPQFKTWIRKRADRMKGRKKLTATAEHLKEYEDVVNTLKTNQKGSTNNLWGNRFVNMNIDILNRRKAVNIMISVANNNSIIIEDSVKHLTLYSLVLHLLRRMKQYCIWWTRYRIVRIA